MSEVFLEVKGIQKSFGGVHALKGVDLTINRGEIHALAGENGSGKSTLIKVISGAHSADAGEICIDGTTYTSLQPMEAIHAGIQVIYQDFSVFPNMTVAENIALNSSLKSDKRLVSWNEMDDIAQTALDRIGADIPLNILVERLSVANKQLVAICRALISDAKLVIMDEPTTALTAKEVAKLFEIIKMLQEQDIAVLIVNHKLDEVYDIAETLTILRNGRKVAHGPIHDFDRAAFVKHMTGREIEDVYYRPKPKKKKILEVEGLECDGEFSDVTFTLNEGDILGITGLLGSGRGEIGEALFGVTPPTGGTIRLEGEEIEIHSTKDALRNSIGYVPEDRLTEGLFLDISIGLNILAASMKSYLRQGRLNYGLMKKSMWEWIDKLNVVTPSPDPAIRTLSGGNQQKVALAKWLDIHPRVLILNGPTVGVDIGSKADIHEILRTLVEDGVGVIIISDDLPEIIQNCNKILIMQQGTQVALFDTEELTEDKLANLLGQEA